jgi:protease-4
LEVQNSANSATAGSWVHLGLEYELAKGLQLRSGLTRGHGTAGLTLSLPFVAVEYATEFDVKPLYYLGFKFGLDRDPIDPTQKQNFLFRQKEFVELSLAGALTSGQSTGSLLGGNVQGVDPILELLRNAKKDDHVEGIIIRLGGLDTGLGTVAIVQEIRKELLDFKASGKKIYIYLESEALGNGYYLASVADYIMLPPGGAVGLLGLKLTVQRITQLYEKVGISWHVIKQGQYKDATNPFSKKMTPEQQAQLEHVVNDLYQIMIADIKKDNEDNNRLLKNETLDQLKEGQLVSAYKAKEWKLVNDIGYYEDLLKHVDDSINTNDPAAIRGRILPLSVYRNDYEQGDFSYFLPFNNRIAIIDIDGEIVQGNSGSNFLFGGKSLGSETVVKQLAQAMNDDQVKAIILRINSPGGSAIASDQIYQKVIKVKEKGKLVVASLGNLAASGGYYIASAADVIIGNSGTLAGSIGVIGMFPSYEKFNQIFGIDYTQIKSGTYLDMFDTHRTPTKEELKMVEDLMSETYEQFVEAVAKGRGKKVEEIKKLAGGQVYSGKQAMELGLIDKIGTYSDAIDEVVTRKHLKEYQFVRYTESADPFMGPVRQGVKQILGIPDSGLLPELKAKMNQMQMIY